MSTCPQCPLEAVGAVRCSDVPRKQFVVRVGFFQRSARSGASVHIMQGAPLVIFGLEPISEDMTSKQPQRSQYDLIIEAYSLENVRILPGLQYLREHFQIEGEKWLLSLSYLALATP